MRWPRPTALMMRPRARFTGPSFSSGSVSMSDLLDGGGQDLSCRGREHGGVLLGVLAVFVCALVGHFLEGVVKMVVRRVVKGI